jgi:hypothetical protein
MDKNVEYVFVHLQYSNGKVIVVFINGHLYVKPVVNKKIYVKFVLLIYNLDYQCKSEIRDVEKMVNIFLIKILPTLIVLK